MEPTTVNPLHTIRTTVIAACLSLILCGPLTMQAQNNALWVWNTRQIIDQPEWKDSLLAVTVPLKINTLFLFFPYDISQNGDSITFYKRNSLIALLRWAKQQSLSVHALAGEPEWALQRNHHKPQTFAREVVKLYGETGLPDGIQFDIEPYLLLPFSLPQTKQQVIREWINGVWKTGKIVRQAQGLLYGIATPFWMEDTISVDHVRLPIGLHLAYLTDYIAVMSYRNRASGPASVITFSDQERRWARQAKRKIYMGIETQRLGGSVSHFLCEVQPDTFSRRIGLDCGEYADFQYRNRKISVLLMDGKMLLGVSGSGVSGDELLEIRRCFLTCFGGTEITVPLKRVKEYIRVTGEWESADLFTVADGTNGLRLTSGELRRSTMFSLSPEEMMSEYSLLLRHAEQYPEITGVAVHDLISVRKFLIK
jgi:hypothetical protein